MSKSIGYDSVAGRAGEIARLREMRFACLLEGATLIALVCVAVPVKHLAGYQQATALMGPIHGAAFLFYVWMVARTLAGGGWSKRDVMLLTLLAFIPFGGLANERMLKRREAALGSQG